MDQSRSLESSCTLPGYPGYPRDPNLGSASPQGDSTDDVSLTGTLPPSVEMITRVEDDFVMEHLEENSHKMAATTRVYLCKNGTQKDLQWNYSGESGTYRL